MIRVSDKDMLSDMSGSIDHEKRGDDEHCDSTGAACCQADNPATAWCNVSSYVNCNNNPTNPTCQPCGDNDTVCCSANGRAGGAHAAADYCKERECDDSNTCSGVACGLSGQKCCSTGPPGHKCR